jgi:uncharacterized protein (TIGR02466 family)
MEILPVFASFLIQEKLGVDTQLLKDWAFCQPALAESKIELNFKEKELQPLYKSVNNVLNELHTFLGFKSTTKQELYEGWVNLETTDRTSVPHTHPRAHYICIYYPHIVGNVGYLELTNPNNALEYVLPQTNLENIVENHNIFNSALWRIEPQEDLLIVIPAWLQHYVRPNLPGAERMSIALNSKIVTSI